MKPFEEFKLQALAKILGATDDVEKALKDFIYYDDIFRNLDALDTETRSRFGQLRRQWFEYTRLLFLKRDGEEGWTFYHIEPGSSAVFFDVTVRDIGIVSDCRAHPGHIWGACYLEATERTDVKAFEQLLTEALVSWERVPKELARF